MHKQDFEKWVMDFSARFPATGGWLKQLPKETREIWFQDCFSRFELMDCLAYNRELMDAGDLEAYQRERIPSLFIKRCSQLQFEREQGRIRRMQERRAAEYQLRGVSVGDAMVRHFTPCMLRAYQETTLAMMDAKNRGQAMSEAEIRELAGKLMDEYDTNEDDQQRTYKCLSCHDSGFVGYRDGEGRPMAGHCDCDMGEKRREAWQAKGRTIGRASNQVKSEWEIA